MTRVNSWNEWDPLKHVIVGRIDSRMVGAPEAGQVLDLPGARIAAGEWIPIADHYVEKAHEQMENFASMLAARGIRVDRPTSMDDRQYVRTPDWECSHMVGTMPPRDLLLCHGKSILEAIVSLRPGLLILNPTYTPLIPEFVELFRMNDWKVIEAVPPSGAKQPPYSMWHECLGYNVFSLDPKTVSVEANERPSWSSSTGWAST